MDNEQRDRMEDEEDRPRPKPRVVDKRVSARPVTGSPPPESTPQAPPERPAEPPTGDGTPSVAGSQEPAPHQHQEPPGQAPPVWTPEQEAEARRMAEEIARVGASEWVVSAAMNLVNVAGVKLETGPLDDASLAIDALAAIIRDTGSRLGDAEAPLRQVLSQLQIAYARAATPGPATP